MTSTVGATSMQRARQVFDILAEMRRRPAEQRKRDANIAAEDVAERKIDDGALPGTRELRVVLDHVARGGDVRPMRRPAHPSGWPVVPEV